LNTLSNTGKQFSRATSQQGVFDCIFWITTTHERADTRTKGGSDWATPWNSKTYSGTYCR
jgi:hypothetical protein